MPEYSADQIIGATLYAKQAVQLRQNAFDNSPVIRTVNAGELVGVVYAYLEPIAGRSSLYWMFYDTNGIPFYAPHAENLYDPVGVNENLPTSTEGSWWDGLFPDPTQGFTSQISKYMITGGLVYLSFKYGPELIKAIKSK